MALLIPGNIYSLLGEKVIVQNIKSEKTNSGTLQKVVYYVSSTESSIDSSKSKKLALGLFVRYLDRLED